MPDSDLELVAQRIRTVLGPLEIALPPGAAMLADPGAVEGSAWYWSPRPGTAVLTISDGDATLRTAGTVLALERSVDGVTVEVVRDRAADATGQHELEFLSTPAASRTFTADESGHGQPSAGTEPTTRARFRFWQSGGSAVRVGYRLDDTAAADWRDVLDRILDTARVVTSPR